MVFTLADRVGFIKGVSRSGVGVTVPPRACDDVRQLAQMEGVRVASAVVRTLLPILIAGAAIYLLLLVFVYLYQARLIYFPNVPGRELTANPASIGLAFEDVRIPTADHVELHGWLIPAGDGAATVLFCHGNAGNISHRLEQLAIFHDLGLAVLLFDYRGYGQSGGWPSEQGTYLDAQAVWTYLTQRRGVAPRNIVIAGESLGGAVAAELAHKTDPAALILASTFTSAPDLARRFYWYLPVRLLARFEYPTAEHVAAVRAPLLVIHSRDDEIVPFSHAEELMRRATGPKQLLEIFGDHNAGFLMSGPRFVEGMRAFLATHGLVKA
jgi:uncharacterized protein